jgi:CopG family transcriptional regulator, nickel-responsive regulator
MQRVTISLDETLVEQFDEFRAVHGYGNRSEAFRDLLRERLGSDRLTRDVGGDCVASLTYVFDHHERELASRLTRASHDNHDLVVSTLHVHLDHDNCMETTVLRGPVRRVREFADGLTTQPGVRHSQLNILPVELREEAHGHGPMDAPHRHLHAEPLN